MKQYRHGDLLIIEVENIPESAKKVKHKILSEGEVTGHAHRLTGKASVFEDTDGTLYFNAVADATVTHEEHGTIPLAPGIHKVIRQREYDYYEKAVRNVED